MTVGAAVAVLLGAVVALMGLTAAGGRQRGDGIARSIASGLLFPITWAVWYVVDERRGRTPPSA